MRKLLVPDEFELGNRLVFCWKIGSEGLKGFLFAPAEEGDQLAVDLGNHELVDLLDVLWLAFAWDLLAPLLAGEYFLSIILFHNNISNRSSPKVQLQGASALVGKFRDHALHSCLPQPAVVVVVVRPFLVFLVVSEGPVENFIIELVADLLQSSFLQVLLADSDPSGFWRFLFE